MTCNITCEVNTQICIPLFQQSMPQVKKTQNSAICSVMIGAGLIALGTNDYIELIQVGMKKLLGRKINRKQADMIFLVANGSLKMGCGILFMIDGFDAKPYRWNSTVNNKCLTLAEQSLNATIDCTSLCLSTMKLLPFNRIRKLTIAAGSMNLTASVVALGNDMIQVFKKVKTKQDEEEMLIEDPYREKKSKIRLMNNVLQLVLSVMILSIFLSNVVGNMSDIYGKPTDYPSIQDKCGSFCG